MRKPRNRRGRSTGQGSGESWSDYTPYESPPPPSTEREWFYRDDGGVTKGPLQITEVEELFCYCDITLMTYVRKGSEGDWRRLIDVKEMRLSSSREGSAQDGGPFTAPRDRLGRYLNTFDCNTPCRGVFVHGWYWDDWDDRENHVELMEGSSKRVIVDLLPFGYNGVAFSLDGTRLYLQRWTPPREGPMGKVLELPSGIEVDEPWPRSEEEVYLLLELARPRTAFYLKTAMRTDREFTFRRASP